MSLNDYNDPNEVWRRTGYNPYKGMNEKERIRTGCLQGLVLLIMTMVGLLLCALLQGCKSVEYVPVTQQHTEHHWHTDSIHQTDSIIKETTTTVMQLDSAAMAKYGIQLKSAERAWLVKTAELERQIQQLMQMSQQKDSVHDTIPMPYPVIKEVPAELSTWQSFRMTLGTIAMCLLSLYVIYRIIRKRFFP